MFSEEWLAEKLAGGEHKIISELSHRKQLPEAEEKKPAGKRDHKYNAKRKEVNGITFASTGEAERYKNLVFYASLGLITHGEKWLQVPYVVQGAAVDSVGQEIKEVKYVADFVYSINGETVAEDFKGALTKEFIKKYKLFRQRYPNQFLWVNRDKEAIFNPNLKGFYEQQFKQWSASTRGRKRPS